MATVTVRNLDEATRQGLKALGVRHGRSMEAEARAILTRAVQQRPADERGLGSRIHALLADEDWPEIERESDEASSADIAP